MSRQPCGLPVLHLGGRAPGGGTAKVMLGPERRPEIVRGTLTSMIAEVRGLGDMLAAQTSTPVPNVDTLTDIIRSAHQLHGLAD
jgi:hypothetical protein